MLAERSTCGSYRHVISEVEARDVSHEEFGARVELGGREAHLQCINTELLRAHRPHVEVGVQL